MEKEAANLVSGPETVSAIEEGSSPPPRSAPSITSTSNPDAGRRQRPRNSRFKGVVPHPNGHWGSQIYADHRRLWLGTFKTEEEAAAGYDRAAMKLRTHEHLRGARNLPQDQILTAQELTFQSSYTAEAVVDMIRDGSYQAKFDDFRNGLGLGPELPLFPVKAEVMIDQEKKPDENYLRCRRLFQKDLTPSDVGKLNRVVIPKKCAVKFFPPISEERGAAGGDEDIQVRFYDSNMKVFEFRYCYWKSSQSYVFTRGWNKFVKEKGLAANDTVAFSLCEGSGANPAPFFLIDAVKNPNDGGLGQEVQVGFGQRVEDHGRQAGGAERKSLRLFGVDIMV